MVPPVLPKWSDLRVYRPAEITQNPCLGGPNHQSCASVCDRLPTTLAFCLLAIQGEIVKRTAAIFVTSLVLVGGLTATPVGAAPSEEACHGQYHKGVNQEFPTLTGEFMRELAQADPIPEFPGADKYPNLASQFAGPRNPFCNIP